MKWFVCLLLAFMGILKFAQADTITYWHVYFNDSLIADFNVYSSNGISLKIDRIESGDYLSFQLFQDYSCAYCKKNLLVVNKDNRQVTRRSCDNPRSLLAFPLSDLLDEYQNHGKKYFEVLYFEGSQVEYDEVLSILKIRLME